MQSSVQGEMHKANCLAAKLEGGVVFTTSVAVKSGAAPSALNERDRAAEEIT